MWVTCRCGRKHFGLYGAAGMVLVNSAGQVLLAHRSANVQFSGTWSFPGGALEPGETPAEAAVRELDEEIGIPPSAVTVVSTLDGTDHKVWRYTYVLGWLDPQWTGAAFTPNWETLAITWVAPDRMTDLPLHPDLRNDVPMLRAAIATMTDRQPILDSSGVTADHIPVVDDATA